MDCSLSLDSQERLERENTKFVVGRNNRRIYVAVFRNADEFY